MSAQELILSLSIPSTALAVDYDDGFYVVGTTAGELYVIDETGQYTVTSLGWYINDVRIENGFIAVAMDCYVIRLELPQGSLTPQESWRTYVEYWVTSVDISADGNYIAYLTPYRLGVLRSDGTHAATYGLGSPYSVWWLDATWDMEYIAITCEPCPPGPGGVQSGVELYRFDGTGLYRMWGTVLIYTYETVEVRISEDKRYVAAATSSGTDMALMDLATGAILWRYNAGAEQFAVDGDANLNYVIGGTETGPYKYFILRNYGTYYQLIAEGAMNGAVNDLDSTPDGLYFAFGSDAGEFILLKRTDETTAEIVLTGNVGRIDAIEIGSTSLLVGGDCFINLYGFVPIEIHDVAIAWVEAPAEVFLGDIVYFNVSVVNEGNFNESFDVVALCHNVWTCMGCIPDPPYEPMSLTPSENRTITFAWNTTEVDMGLWEIKFKATAVEGEIDVADNVYTVYIMVYGGSLYVEPSIVEYWTPAYGETFSIDVNVFIAESVELYGYEFKLYWNTTLLDLLSVNVTPPPGWVPSESCFIAKNETDEALGRYWLAVSMLNVTGVYPFSDNASLVTLTFKIAYDAIYPENVTTLLDLVDTYLSDPNAEPIPHLAVDGEYWLYSTKPKVTVEPSRYTAKKVETFSVNITVHNVVNLYSYEFKLGYDTALLDALSLNVGDFLKQPYYMYKFSIDDDAGVITLGVSSKAPAPPVNGSGLLATITFKTLAIVWPDPARNTSLHLYDTVLKTNLGVTVPHGTVDGFYQYTPVPGDVNSDGVVNIFDLVTVARAFGTKPGEANWNPKADLKRDELINIFDVVLVAKNYGRTDP